MFEELKWDDERLEHIAEQKVEIPDSTNWKSEAEFWDRTDTASLMEDEEGEWVGPGHVRPAPGLCQRCGAQMERHRLDVNIAHGRIILHETEFYVCPRCGARALPPDRQEFVAWSERMPVLETTST
jgi:DNA-directed RNA polymerase subunit RPC12/RpoP